jgi:hypothetical protein
MHEAAQRDWAMISRTLRNARLFNTVIYTLHTLQANFKKNKAGKTRNTY